MRPSTWIATWFATTALCACVTETEPDVCEQAQLRFQQCGVTVPLFAADNCSNASEAIAECVLDISEGCNDLSSWLTRLDECVDDVGNGLEPLDTSAGESHG